MTVQEVLLPLFLEVILTFVLLFWLAPLRGRDFSSGVARPENVALREPNWSQRSLQVSYSYSNQLTAGPVLRADDPGLGDAACGSHLRAAGLDIRDLPLSAGLCACDQQSSAAARRVLRCFGGCARDHVAHLHCRDTDRSVGLIIGV